MKKASITILLSINDKPVTVFAEKANIFDDNAILCPSIATFHISTDKVGRDKTLRTVKSLNYKKSL